LELSALGFRSEKMASTKSRKARALADGVQQPTPPTQDEFSDSYNGLESDDPMEKDETELELEKLVFGDEAGFQEGLSTYRSTQAELSPVSDDEILQDRGEGLTGVDDADVSLDVLLRRPIRC